MVGSDAAGPKSVPLAVTACRSSEPHPEHVVYPYLLRGLTISRVNHVWATDISVPQKAA
jgi:hypothetical protein